MPTGTVVLRRETGRVTRAGALFFALLLAAGVWGGTAMRRAPGATTGLASATLAVDVSPNHEPINPTTVFAPDVVTIRLAFKMTQAQPGSKLKAAWRAVNVGASLSGFRRAESGTGGQMIEGGKR